MVKTVSIKKNSDFLKAYKKGKFYVGKLMVLYFRPNGMEFNRLGITASRKLGGSVKRNRFRRLIKENYRLLEDNIKCGFDFVIVAREAAILPDFSHVRKEMKFLFRKLELFIDVQ